MIYLIHTDSSIKAFETLGRLYPNATTLSQITLDFFSIPPNQFGLNETELQTQPMGTIGNTTLETLEAKGKPWPLAMSIEYANR
jgi:alpha,alpha-trehalase